MQRDQREQPGHRRGFYIHQKVVLELDFSGVLFGYTEITVVPTAKNLTTLHLHSKQCVIHHVTVGGTRAEAFQWDPTAHLNVSNPKDCHVHPELKRRVYSAYAEADEGELSIAIPPVALPSRTRARSQSEPPTAMHAGEFAPLIVRIEYSLHNPVDGVQFVVPSDMHPYRAPHVYTTPSAPDAARCWVPCLDSMSDKCTWEFQFVVPRYLEEGAELGEDTGSYPTVVICSGDFGEQITHPSQSGKAIFTFSQSDIASVQQISWAAGPFHVYPVPTEHLDDSAATQPLMHAFCLPGHETQLVASVTFLRSAMNFFMSDMGSYPFNSHKLVFVEELPTQRFDASTMSLCTVDLLHGEDAIDQVFETRLFLSHALACQWAGINIQPKTPSDTWLVNGLSLYMTSCFLRRLFGNNEHRYRLKKDMDRVLEWDNGNMPPICQPQVLEEPEGAVLNFINLKAPLVLHILDRRLTKSGTSLGLSRVLPKLFLQAMSGELAGNALGTHAFLRLCRKVSGMDPRSFAEQWIYGSGFPSFQFQASFNRKKMAVEILMRQECPAHKLHAHDAVGRELFAPVPFFEGQMTIRIHEADGTPYEHVLDIRSPFKRFEVPFNTKYKRVRRNTKRYMARQAAAQAAADGEDTAAGPGAPPGPGELVDVGFAVEIWEHERERENWKIAEWSEEDEQRMAGATYEWIRLDVDLEWIAALTFEQPDFMWVSQLQRDRDVVAQLEAVHALRRQPTAIISSVLVKTVLVPKYFYRIRCEAAVALASCAIPKLDYLGLFHLFKLFLRYCYEPEDPRQDLFTHTYVPRSNDFSDIPEYFVRKALINGLSRVRFDNGKTPSIIRTFLADQLRFNDNTSNPYSDALYVCTIIAALAGASVPTKPPERNEIAAGEVRVEHTPEDARLLQTALAEVDRYRSMDRLIPSAHNVVTIASIEFYVLLSMADLIPSDPRTFFPLTREGNYTHVRIAAFDALFLTKWYTPKIMRYFFAVMAHDSSRTVRRHVARTACHSLALLFAMGELKAAGKDAEALLIEEDGSAPPERAKEAKKSEVEVMIRAFRKDRELGKSEVLREFLMPIALAPDVDHEVRWYLLKLADMLLRGTEETLPKPKIYLPPPTPVVEAPPTLAIKVKREKTLPPATPTISAPKLKLSFNTGGSTPGASTSKPLPPMRVAPPKGRGSTPVPGSSRPPPPKGQNQNQNQNHKPVSKAVPKSRSGGMASTEYKAAKRLLGELLRNKHAPLFLVPVDPVRDRAPNYFDVIKEPMDLSTMSAKLEAGQYKDLGAFELDFVLMISNCKHYNADGTYAFNEAIALDNFFRKEMQRIKNTLSKFNASRQAEVQHSVPVSRESMPPPLPPPAAAAPSRPTIKLSLPSKKSKDSPRASPAPSISASSKPKKPKSAVDLPPPPYVDDGSHDLLQEVIAIENARDEKRSSGSIKLGGAKRKRAATGTVSDGDGIASAPTPKKDRPSPAPSQASSHAEAPPRPKPKLVIAPKAKRATTDSVSASPAPAPSPSVPATPTPTPSRKGKEKEVASAASPAPTSLKIKSSANHAAATPIDTKKCKEIVKTLLRMPEAIIFARPVDPVLDGCPTYLDEIKHPMDLGTMQTKLSNGKYSSMEGFAADYRLMMRNCRAFNPPMTYPTDCADALDKMFDKEWSRASEKKMSFPEKRSLQNVLAKLVQDPLSWVFREPVDPIALGIPMYYDIIPKRDARDLRTIRQKLDGERYESVDAFEADLELMVANAIKFNGAESEVGQIALQLRAKARDALVSVNPSRKRKDGGGTPAPGAKKVKLT